ncbi:MAG: hypothetical protein CMN04_09625 [Roseibacillus sp.]|nr:hypothetical protein [Roseibacillus sp.]
MKTNFSFAACLLLLSLNAVSASLPVDSEPLLPGSALDCRHDQKEQLLLAPVNPRLSLDLTRSEMNYPQVNVTLGGDLCRSQDWQKPSRKVQRGPHYLSVELACVDEGRAQIRGAVLSPWLLLLLPLLLLPCSLLRSGCE